MWRAPAGRIGPDSDRERQLSVPAVAPPAIPAALLAALPDGGPYRLTMGLRPLAEHRWLEPGTDRAVQLATKDRLLAGDHASVVAHIPSAAAASAETLDTLLAHLATTWPALYRRSGSVMTDRETGRKVDLAALHPIDGAGRLLPEDLCVMIPDGGVWRLGAASVCFPSRWSLAAKIGRALDSIHAPVPGYDRALGRPTERFFDRLPAGRLLWRSNWTLLDDPELFQPAVRRPAGAGALVVRVERQTLRRLPRSGAVVFGIRTLVAPLAEVIAGRPELAARLASTLRSVPPATIAYKGWQRILPAALAILGPASGTPPEPASGTPPEPASGTPPEPASEGISRPRPPAAP